MPPRSADIVLVSPQATSLYVEDPQGTGGGELQMFYLARSLVAAGFSVAHLVFDHDDLPAERDGVVLARLPPRVLPSSSPRATGRLSRALARLRATRQLLAALLRLNPRLVIQRNAGFDTGVVGLFAKLTNRRFIFSSSSSADFTLTGLESRNTRLAYCAGLRLAHRVVVQTDDQRHLALDLRGRDARVVRSFCEPAPASTDATRTHFLWIGRMNDNKRPMAYLDLAARLPQARFLMVCPDRRSGWERLSEQVRARASALPNCELLPACPRSELLELYSAAVAVVNTSSWEGFPNTFMEGWARGAPALSLSVDPDARIRDFKLGAVANGSMDALACEARALWDQRGDNASQGERVRNYVAQHHAPEVIGARWTEVVASLISGK